MNDKKIISAIEARDEQMLAFVVQKFSKLLWKIAASILINATSAQDVEECVADVFIVCIVGLKPSPLGETFR